MASSENMKRENMKREKLTITWINMTGKAVMGVDYPRAFGDYTAPNEVGNNWKVTGQQ